MIIRTRVTTASRRRAHTASRARVHAAGVAAAAALLGLLGAGSVAADPVPTPLTPSATAPALAAQDQVEAFFTAYRNARLGTTEDATPAEVRARFLTKELNQALDVWAAAHTGQDPVFRAPNVPSAWTFTSVGADGSSVVVTQKWGDGTTADVAYTVRPGDRMITAIADPPAVA
ncbi:hypothetical protein ACFVYD_24370 [Streptomyces sp. NPDC058301]|uniref:hypothetical protein n=1 Tax=Streptomyces sp. NPDC058301 TaxID=3346436 RepID=UPI0036E1813E